jgi:hypothetical protein
MWRNEIIYKKARKMDNGDKWVKICEVITEIQAKRIVKLRFLENSFSGDIVPEEGTETAPSSS